MGGLRRGSRGKGPAEKAKDFKGTTKKLVNNYLSNYKLLLLIVFIFSIASTVFSVIIQIFGKKYISLHRDNI